MDASEHELLAIRQRLARLEGERVAFHQQVTTALTAIVERLDRIEQRLDHISRAIQPRLVAAPFARSSDQDPADSSVTDSDPVRWDEEAPQGEPGGRAKPALGQRARDE